MPNLTRREFFRHLNAAIDAALHDGLREQLDASNAARDDADTEPAMTAREAWVDTHGDATADPWANADKDPNRDPWAGYVHVVQPLSPCPCVRPRGRGADVPGQAREARGRAGAVPVREAGVTS